MISLRIWEHDHIGILLVTDRQKKREMSGKEP